MTETEERVLLLYYVAAKGWAKFPTAEAQVEASARILGLTATAVRFALESLRGQGMMEVEP